jgi:hypothetical protein
MSKDLTPLFDLYASLAQSSIDARKDAETARGAEQANGYEYEDTIDRIEAEARADTYHHVFVALSAVMDDLLN